MKKKKFNFKAVVSRQFVDDIVLSVEAESQNVAVAKANRVLNVFPQAHEETDVPVCYIKARGTDHIEVLSIIEDDDGRA